MEPDLSFLEEDLELIHQTVHSEQLSTKEETESDYDTDIDMPGQWDIVNINVSLETNKIYVLIINTEDKILHQALSFYVLF